MQDNPFDFHNEMICYDSGQDLSTTTGIVRGVYFEQYAHLHPERLTGDVCYTNQVQSASLLVNKILVIQSKLSCALSREGEFLSLEKRP